MKETFGVSSIPTCNFCERRCHVNSTCHLKKSFPTTTTFT